MQAGIPQRDQVVGRRRSPGPGGLRPGDPPYFWLARWPWTSQSPSLDPSVSICKGKSHLVLCVELLCQAVRANSVKGPWGRFEVQEEFFLGRSVAVTPSLLLNWTSERYLTAALTGIAQFRDFSLNIPWEPGPRPARAAALSHHARPPPRGPGFNPHTSPQGTAFQDSCSTLSNMHTFAGTIPCRASLPQA